LQSITLSASRYRPAWLSFTLALGAAQLVAPLGAAAQAVPAVPVDSVVVTATRLPSLTFDTLLHTSVITRADIERLAPRDVLSLLRREAGIDIAQNGHPGSVASLFLRGAESRQTLVLIDGVRAGSATIGATALDQLAPDSIERIEIVRGNVSSLYGANAIGGVINIITRRGSSGFNAQASLMAGSRSTAKVAVGAGGTWGPLILRADLSSNRSDGVTAIAPDRSPTVNPDRDGYRNTSGSLGIEAKLAPHSTLAIQHLQSRGDLDFDNAFARSASDAHQSDTRVETTQIRWEWVADSAWSGHARAAEGSDLSDNFTNGTRASRFETRQSEAQVLVRHQHPVLGQTTGTLEQLEERVAATTAYVRNSRRVKSGSVLWTSPAQSADRLQWQLAGRTDTDSVFGRAETGLASIGWRLSPRSKLIGTLATAFAAPTFNQLYFPGFGNPNLRAERSRSIELGWAWQVESTALRVQGFQTRYRDLIASGPPSFLPENIQRARIHGLETTLRQSFQTSHVDINYTWQDPLNQVTGQRLLRRPTHKVKGEWVGTFDRWTTTLQGEYVGARDDRGLTTSAAFKAPAYRLMNVYLGYRLGPGAHVRLRLDNVTDKAYETAAGYAMPRRGAFVSMHWAL
jgi:vitamin B12 transporter